MKPYQTEKKYKRIHETGEETKSYITKGKKANKHFKCLSFFIINKS